MFSKVALFITAALAVTVLADGQCNSGPVQCCDSLQESTSPATFQKLDGLIGVAAQNVVGMVGFNCNPITGIGAGVGANCASGPVCCEKNFQEQLVGINCTPVTASA